MRRQKENRYDSCENPAEKKGMGTSCDVEVLTKAEACRYIRCGISTIPKLGLPVIRIGRSVKYLKSDLEAYLLSNRQGGGNE